MACLGERAAQQRRACHVAVLLVLAAVDANRLHALQQQVLLNVVHVALLLAEDEHGRRRLLQALQQIHDPRLPRITGAHSRQAHTSFLTNSTSCITSRLAAPARPTFTVMGCTSAL